MGEGSHARKAKALMTLTIEPPDTKQARAFHLIRSRILSGQYGPEFRITVESVAAELHTSLGPVREAIRRLEAEGLISYRKNVGATVIPMSREALADTLIAAAILEGAATALSAPLLTMGDLDNLDSLNRQMEDAIEQEDFALVSRLNREFHKHCYARCPNAWLLQLLDTTTARSYVGRRSLFFDLPQRPRRSVQEHRELVALLREHASPDEIEMFVRRHKQVTVKLSIDRSSVDSASANQEAPV